VSQSVIQSPTYPHVIRGEGGLPLGAPSAGIPSSASSSVIRSQHDWHFQAPAQTVGNHPASPRFRVGMYGPLLTHFPHSSILVFFFSIFFSWRTDKNGEMTGFIIGDKMPLTRDIVSPVQSVQNGTATGYVLARPPEQPVLSGILTHTY